MSHMPVPMYRSGLLLRVPPNHRTLPNAIARLPPPLSTPFHPVSTVRIHPNPTQPQTTTPLPPLLPAPPDPHHPHPPPSLAELLVVLWLSAAIVRTNAHVRKQVALKRDARASEGVGVLLYVLFFSAAVVWLAGDGQLLQVAWGRARGV